jgi:hypothetical protein
VQRWMSDPDIRMSLADPYTAKVIEEISKEGRPAFDRHCNRSAIKKLIAAGIIMEPPKLVPAAPLYRA